MNKFDIAIRTVLKHEGGYVNDPDDPGGATNYGISLRWLKKTGDLDDDGLPDGDIDHDGDIDIDDIKALDIDAARELYRKYWWLKYKYNEINSLTVATKLLDLSINMGARQAHKLIQRACKACGAQIKDDGILGPISLRVINSISGYVLIAAFRSEAAGFYRVLIAKKPIFGKYQNGWLKRAYD